MAVIWEQMATHHRQPDVTRSSQSLRNLNFSLNITLVIGTSVPTVLYQEMEEGDYDYFTF
jgi:hypothetical protein